MGRLRTRFACGSRLFLPTLGLVGPDPQNSRSDFIEAQACCPSNLQAVLNLEFRPKLFQQLRPGTRVVSHAFNMGDWEPDTVV